MAEKCRLLIADTVEAFRLALQEVLQDSYDIRICRDGRTALELLRRFQPDLVVLDMMLPGLDGISLLQAAAKEGIHPIVLATTRYYNDYILDSAAHLGVDYIMVKPCDITSTVDRIRDLSRGLRSVSQKPPDPHSQASGLLLRLGISTKLHGYLYLREAILVMAGNPGLSITKELYPTVARRCGSNVIKVERSIRTAIQMAWEKRDERIWQLYFAPDSGGSIPRPSNGTFISRLAEELLPKGEN